MKASHLQEAAGIVSSIAWIKKARGYVLSANAVHMVMISEDAHGRKSNDNVQIPRPILCMAEREWRKHLDAREAELRRRAAQIDLTLEDAK